MRDNSIILLGVAIAFIVLAIAMQVGSELQELRLNQTPRCYEDEAIVWQDDAHSLCVPIDNIVDMGIENAIQMGVLEYSK